MTATAEDGATNYYGRPALKPAPFNNWVVGGYIFVAGLSGAAAILATAADAAGGREAKGVVRRGRLLPLLAPTLGAAMLIWDLHTPQRFYNMFRVAKRTSPMSVGTWILTAFGLSGGFTAALQFLAGRRPRLTWPLPVARVAGVPTAVLGAGMSTYTASLLAATSTPLWAAAPSFLAAQFGASSMASAAASLSLGEEPGQARAALDAVACAALAVELVAGAGQAIVGRRKGIGGGASGAWGLARTLGATGAGTALPLALHGLARARGQQGNLSRVASLLILGGSLLLRVATLGAGNATASDPDVSLRFAQPGNLPRLRRGKTRHRRPAR